jgi:hypothetical protein
MLPLKMEKTHFFLKKVYKHGKQAKNGGEKRKKMRVSEYQKAGILDTGCLILVFS